LPGGGVNYLESLEQAALREFHEETGLYAQAIKQYFVSEVIEPETPWHSIAISFLGIIIGGSMQAEDNHFSAKWGDKTPRWFSEAQLNEVNYHPPAAIKAAFAESRKLR
jgi:ADP-ribose pyrophosphatase YjhB (NUDIX family)